MAELQSSLLLNVESPGELVAFDVTGFTQGMLQFVMRSGVWAGAIVGLKQMNEQGEPEPYLDDSGNPIFISSDGNSPVLKPSAKYLGAQVFSAGGPGVVRIALRAFVGTNPTFSVTGAIIAAAQYATSIPLIGVVDSTDGVTGNDTFTTPVPFVLGSESVVCGVPMLRGVHYTTPTNQTIVFTATNFPILGQQPFASYYIL